MVTRKSRTKPARAARPTRPAAPARKKPALRTAARPARGAAAPARAEQPLGVGVGDAFAVERLGAARRGSRARQGVRELTWEAFGEIARALAGRIGESFRPQLVVGIARGGLVVGGALAAALDVDFQPLRLPTGRRPSPADAPDPLPELAGKRVLLVDDVCQTGRTLDRGRALLRRAGAAAVRTAAVVTRPRGGRPDWWALQTEAVAVFPWDYQLHTPDLGGGEDPGEAGV